MNETRTGVAELTLTAADGVRLHAEHRLGPATRAHSAGRDTGHTGDSRDSANRAAPARALLSGPVTVPVTEVGVVLAHGFGCSLAKPFLRAVADGLAEHAGVLAFEFRGHGRSTGMSTLGNAEVLDVDAAVAAARAFGYQRVVTVGFSMGGAAVLRHAGLLGQGTTERVDAVVCVSTASRWFRTETRPMRRVHWLVETRTGRLVARRLMHTRIAANGWVVAPEAPAEVVGWIAPVPLLIVHGDSDAYFTVDNAEELFAAAGEPRELWVWPGFGHAELAMTAHRTDALGAHLLRLLARGQDNA